MNLAQIKTALNVETLELSYLKDDAGARALDTKTNQPTKWLRHWDNENRLAVVIHEDTLAKVKANKDMPNLGLKHETKTPEGKQSYKMAVIIAYTEADEVL